MDNDSLEQLVSNNPTYQQNLQRNLTLAAVNPSQYSSDPSSDTTKNVMVQSLSQSMNDPQVNNAYNQLVQNVTNQQSLSLEPRIGNDATSTSTANSVASSAATSSVNLTSITSSAQIYSLMNQPTQSSYLVDTKPKTLGNMFLPDPVSSSATPKNSSGLDAPYNSGSSTPGSLVGPVYGSTTYAWADFSAKMTNMYNDAKAKLEASGGYSPNSTFDSQAAGGVHNSAGSVVSVSTSMNNSQQVSADAMYLSTDKSDAVSRYQMAAKSAGLSDQQIKQNILTIDSYTDQKASSGDLSQNSYNDSARSYWSSFENTSAVTGDGNLTSADKSAVAQNDLRHLYDAMLSDKNAFKYHMKQGGSTDSQVSAALSQVNDSANYGLGLTGSSANASSASASNSSNSASSGFDASQSGASTSDNSNTSQTNPTENRKSKTGKNLSLFAKSITVQKVRGKDGKMKYQFKLNAKERAEVDGGKFGGRYLNNSGNTKDHGEIISRKTLDAILKANGLPALSNKQLDTAISSHKPLVNAKDGIIFNADVTKGKTKLHNHIVASSIKASNQPFSYSHEMALEKQKYQENLEDKATKSTHKKKKSKKKSNSASKSDSPSL